MDKYDDFSKDDLIDKVKAQEDMLEALKRKKNEEELLDFPWAGNLGHWHWNVQTDDVVCNDKKITTLNYTKSEIPEELGFEFFTSKLHPDDYEMVMNNMRQHLIGKTNSYEVEYRIQTKDGDYKWYSDIGKITQRDESNEPIMVCGIVFNITKKKEIELTIKKQNEKLLDIVNIDHLTQIHNRKSLFERLKREISISNKEKTKLSVVMMDIDKFRSVNNNHGHLAGDLVIKQVAEVIQSNLSYGSFVGRYGGEEYLVVIPNSDKEKAHAIAEKIRRSIEDAEFVHGIKITISGGVREYDNEEPLHVLVDNSDKNLYKAKNTGRNKIVSD